MSWVQVFGPVKPEIWRQLASSLRKEAHEEFNTLTASLSKRQQAVLLQFMNKLEAQFSKVVVLPPSDRYGGHYNQIEDSLSIHDNKWPLPVRAKIVTHEYTHKVIKNVSDLMGRYPSIYANEAIAYYVGIEKVGAVINISTTAPAIKAAVAGLLQYMFGGDPQDNDRPMFYGLSEEGMLLMVDKACLEIEAYFVRVEKTFKDKRIQLGRLPFFFHKTKTIHA